MSCFKFNLGSIQSEVCYGKGQVDSPESLETTEITEKTENFIKVTRNLTKLKETLINYVCEKSHFKKH